MNLNQNEVSPPDSFTNGERRCVSYLAFAGVLYCGYRLSMALCICPGEGIVMSVCSAIAVVCGPTVLRIIGTLLLALSIYITIDMFQVKAARDAEANQQMQETLNRYSPRVVTTSS